MKEINKNKILKKSLILFKFFHHTQIAIITVFKSYKSSSSCHTTSTDLLDPLSRPISIVHCYRHRAMYIAGRPAFACLYEEVHRSILLTSSSLLLQQCPACLVRLTCIVFMIGGRWPYSCCSPCLTKSWVYESYSSIGRIK